MKNPPPSPGFLGRNLVFLIKICEKQVYEPPEIVPKYAHPFSIVDESERIGSHAFFQIKHCYISAARRR